MSRIYDALQRAEQERKSAPDTAVDTSLQKQEEQPGPAEVRQVDHGLSSQALVLPLEARLSESSGELPESWNVSVLDRIRTEVWKPKVDLLPTLQERGRIVEQFRSLRSRLFALRDEKPLKSIAVTSGLPKEGKTFVAANLAVSFARHKAGRVLLIDGDMRRSTLQDVFGCAVEPGLSTYLNGTANLLDIMQKVRIDQETDPLLVNLESLTLITGGSEGDKSAELSGSVRFKELLARAEEVFDWIVVDTSPVNLVADGVNLAQACDGVLVVVRGGVTKIETIQSALGELKSSRMLGVVLNALTTPKGAESYYGYGSYDSLKK